MNCTSWNGITQAILNVLAILLSVGVLTLLVMVFMDWNKKPL